MRARRVLAAVVIAALAAPAATRAADETTQVLVDVAHTNAVPDSPLRPPLALRWRSGAGSVWSNVLVSGGRVLYVARGADFQPVLTALSTADGHVLWSKPMRTAAVALDGGRLFVLTPVRDDYPSDVRAVALDPATGAELWHRDLPASYGPGSGPVAAGGQLFFLGNAPGTLLYGLRASDGASLWPAKDITSGSGSTPALDGSTLYVSVAGQQTYAIDRATGAERWHSAGCCTGGGGDTPALAAGRLFAYEQLIHDAGSGAVLGNWRGAVVPTLVGDGGVQWGEYKLRAFGPAYETTRWTFNPPDGYVLGRPLVAGPFVYTSVSDWQYNARDVVALSLADGSPAWCVRLDLPPDTPSDFSVAPVAAGEGLLLVNAGGGLAAFENGGSGSTCSATSPAPVAPPTATAPSTTTPPPVVAGPTLTLRAGRRTLEIGKRTRLSGTLSGLPSVVGRTVRIEADPWPFDDRWRAAEKLVTRAGGRFAAWLKPKRNIRVRAVLVRDPAVASAPVDVFADFPLDVRVLGARGPRPRLRVTIGAPRTAAVRKRVVHAYLARGSATTWRKVDGRRWQVQRRRFARVTLRYPRGRLGRRDHWLVCTRETVPDAFGRPAALEPRCGARTLPRGR